MKSIVITEKPSQAYAVRAAVGTRYGQILSAQGHLLALKEPEEINPGWKHWGFDVLRPNGFYPIKPDPFASTGAKRRLKAIENALKLTDRVIIATDCDREGTLVGGELLEYFGFQGEILRAVFTAQDERTIRTALATARPWSQFKYEFAAGKARQQADQIYNLSLTRAVSVAFTEPGVRRVIGIGRVKTPTLAIICMRELEIQNFKSEEFLEVTVRAETTKGTLILRHAPYPRLTNRSKAKAIAKIVKGFKGPIWINTELRRRRPPRLMNLAALQRKCGTWGWSADKTLQIAQILYEEHKILSYPRTESKHLTESQVADVGPIVSALLKLDRFCDLEIGPPVIRKGAGGHFCSECLEGISHHAIIPNINTADKLQRIYEHLSWDTRRLFNMIAANFLAAIMPDYKYKLITVTLEADGAKFKAHSETAIKLGWKSAYDAQHKMDDSGYEIRLGDVVIATKKTNPPPRYSEGSLIDAMENAWKFVENDELRMRLKQAKGIGTPATRAAIIKGLIEQNLIREECKKLVPTAVGMKLYHILTNVAPELVDPAVTAIWELRLDAITLGREEAVSVVDSIAAGVYRLTTRLKSQKGKATISINTAVNHNRC